MEIKEGCYVHVYDNGSRGKLPIPKGAVYVGHLPEKWDERISLQFVEHDDNGKIMVRNGKPVTGEREHRKRMEEIDLLFLFCKTFNERYSSEYYHVRFFYVWNNLCYYDDGETENDFYAVDIESGRGEFRLPPENLVLWKLLLDDALRITAGRQKPLKLAIEIANSIRTAYGREYDNVSNVFQVESAQADFSSQIQATHNVPIGEPMYSAAKTDRSEPYETAVVEVDPAEREALGESFGRNTAKWLVKMDMAKTNMELQEEVLSEMGFTPIEVTDMLHPNTDDRRGVSQRISNESKARKKKPK